jgi:hypothetical protein
MSTIIQKEGFLLGLIPAGWALITTSPSTHRTAAPRCRKPRAADSWSRAGGRVLCVHGMHTLARDGLVSYTLDGAADEEGEEQGAEDHHEADNGDDERLRSAMTRKGSVLGGGEGPHAVPVVVRVLQLGLVVVQRARCLGVGEGARVLGLRVVVGGGVGDEMVLAEVAGAAESASEECHQELGEQAAPGHGGRWPREAWRRTVAD